MVMKAGKKASFLRGRNPGLLCRNIFFAHVTADSISIGSEFLSCRIIHIHRSHLIRPGKFLPLTLAILRTSRQPVLLERFILESLISRGRSLFPRVQHFKGSRHTRLPSRPCLNNLCPNSPIILVRCRNSILLPFTSRSRLHLLCNRIRPM